MSFLDLHNLSLHFGGVVALDDVSLTVNEGEIMSLVGPNGAGKSTLFNVVSRLYDPLTGSITFCNKNLLDYPAHGIASLGIARTFQNIELFEQATVLHNLLVGRHLHSRSFMGSSLLFFPSVRREERAHRLAVERIIDFLDLESNRDKIVSTLPYGIRKVVELGRALCCEPRLLLLDEPASGLSPEESRDMGFWVEDIRNQLGITVLMVEHDMRLVSMVSDRVMALSQGQELTTGTVSEVRSHPSVIEAWLGGTGDKVSDKTGNKTGDKTGDKTGNKTGDKTGDKTGNKMESN